MAKLKLFIVSYIDCAKTFDNIKIKILFSKLIEWRSLPLTLLDYSKYYPSNYFSINQIKKFSLNLYQ